MIDWKMVFEVGCCVTLCLMMASPLILWEILERQSKPRGRKKKKEDWQKWSWIKGIKWQLKKWKERRMYEKRMQTHLDGMRQDPDKDGHS